MTTEKPSKNEDEYFARRDAEIRKARQEAAQRAAENAERRSHHMKCPKCGANLTTEEYHGIQVDRCHECLGVWFDAGEAESLLRGESRGLGLGAILRDLVRGVRRS